MSETTKDYFEREKQSRFLLQDYLDSDYQTIERLNIAKEILGGDVNQYVEYEKDEDTGQDAVDVLHTDRDGIDEAIRSYYEPLSIKKYVSVDPRSNEIADIDDCTYEILITFGGPNVYWNLDRTAELNLYWGSEHYSRDFGGSFVDTILSFYGLY